MTVKIRDLGSVLQSAHRRHPAAARTPDAGAISRLRK